MTAALAIADGSSAAPKLEPLVCHGVTFEIAPGGVAIALRPACDALGLDFSAQRRRLSDPERSPWASVAIMATQGADGQARHVVTIDRETLFVWLATLTPARVAPAVRERIALLQRDLPALLRERGDRRSSPLTMLDAARELVASLEREEDLRGAVAELAPRAALADRLANADGLQTIEAVAKTIGTGRNRLFAWLRSSGFLLATGLPRQTHVDTGRAVVRERTFVRNGVTNVYSRVFVTAKGVAYIASRFGEEAAS